MQGQRAMGVRRHSAQIAYLMRLQLCSLGLLSSYGAAYGDSEDNRILQLIAPSATPTRPQPRAMKADRNYPNDSKGILVTLTPKVRNLDPRTTMQSQWGPSFAGWGYQSPPLLPAKFPAESELFTWSSLLSDHKPEAPKL